MNWFFHQKKQSNYLSEDQQRKRTYQSNIYMNNRPLKKLA